MLVQREMPFMATAQIPTENTMQSESENQLEPICKGETAYEPVQHGPLRCVVGAITQKIALHTVSSADHQYESWQQPRCAVQTFTQGNGIT